MMFDKSFPVPADGWCDPMQWHPANSDHSAAEGSPALNLQCGNDGDDKLYLQVGDKELMPIGSLNQAVSASLACCPSSFSNDSRTRHWKGTAQRTASSPRTSPKSSQR